MEPRPTFKMKAGRRTLAFAIIRKNAAHKRVACLYNLHAIRPCGAARFTPLNKPGTSHLGKEYNAGHGSTGREVHELPHASLGRSAAAAESEDEMQGRLLLDVVVRKRATVLKLLARKDEALLVGRDALGECVSCSTVSSE
jgi:hypothetical protein